MINQNLKILHTASFFTVSKINALLIIFLLRTSSYCIKTSTFTILLWVASHFTYKQICKHIPYFYFPFSVLWSSPAVEQLIKSEFLMTTTYHLLQWLSQYTSRVFGKISFSFSAKPKRIQDRIKEMVTKFS